MNLWQMSAVGLVAVGLVISLPVVADPTTAHAAATESEPAFNRFVFKNHESRAEQVAFARYIRRFLQIEDYRKLIPALSPREEAWLDNELRSANVSRRLAAVGSLEYAIWKARRTIGSIASLTGLIETDPDQVMKHWTVLAYTLIDRSAMEYVTIYCRKARVAGCPFPFGEQESDDVFATFGEMLGQTIVLGVLGPRFGTGFRND